MVKAKIVNRCIDCKHATLKQWYNNPVIALCERTGERYVARASNVCRMFEKCNTTKNIEHYDKY